MADWLGLWLAPAILAVVPAFFRLRRGRTMARYLDDPALPERLLGSRSLLSAVFASAVAVEIVVWPRQLWWSLPLLLLSLMAAGWPLRRAMFKETWSVAAYVWFYVRLVIAIYGFWLLLMAAPWLTRSDGRPWLAPILLGLALVAWNEQHSAILRWIMRARPVRDGPLLARCRAILARAAIGAPRIEFVDMNGGLFANAVALPDTDTPAVVFTSSLLERLDADEAAAIFAHEVAHLEHFNRAYLQRLRWAGWAMVAAAVSIAPLLHAYAPGLERLAWVWPLLVFAYVATLTSRRQKHETDSDLRAVALTGDGEALVRALVKLHALGRVPRRIDPDLEPQLSHPSLARRVQAIRAAAGVTAASLDEPLVVGSGTTTLSLQADRLAWSEPDGTSHALPYAALKDLRVDAGGAGAAQLIAVDAHGRRWTLPLAAADVARVQTVLDVIDARLRPAPAGAGPWRAIGTLAGLLVTVAALAAGQLASAIVALLASFAIDRPLARAAGAAGLVGAAVALRGGGWWEMALVLMVGAALLLFVASRDRREAGGRWTAFVVPALGVLAALMFVPFVFATGGFLAVHQIANRWTTAAVFALAFAAAAPALRGGGGTAWPRRRFWRMAAGAAAAAGAAVLVLGDTRTLDAVLRDPFLQAAGAPAIARIDGVPASRTVMSFTPERVLLSPRAESVAAVTHSDDYRQVTAYVGRIGGPLTAVHSDPVRFVDERRLLVVDSIRDGTVLRLIDTDRPAPAIWESSMEVAQPAISIDRAGRHWRVLGRGPEGSLVQFTGAVNGGAIDRRQWPSPSDPKGQPALPLSAAGPRLLVATTEYDSSLFATLGAWSYWLRPFTTATSFAIVDEARVSPAFSSELHIQCEPGAYSDEGPICSAHDGSRFHLGVVDTADASVTALGTFPGVMSFQVAPGWITGWWNTPFALDRATGRLVLMADSVDHGRRPYMITASEESIGVVLWDRSGAGQTMLEIYTRRAILDQ